MDEWRKKVVVGGGGRGVKERKPEQRLSLRRHMELWEVLIICRVTTGGRRAQKLTSWPTGASTIHQSGLQRQIIKANNSLMCT